MKRREFIAVAGGVALGYPWLANARQSGQVRRIGAIIGFAENDPEVQSFIKVTVLHSETANSSRHG
jgi:hypothetical protein